MPVVTGSLLKRRLVENSGAFFLFTFFTVLYKYYSAPDPFLPTLPYRSAKQKAMSLEIA